MRGIKTSYAGYSLRSGKNHRRRDSRTMLDAYLSGFGILACFCAFYMVYLMLGNVMIVIGGMTTGVLILYLLGLL